MPPTRVIGIDCATVPSKVGLAAGWLADGVLEVDQVRRGHSSTVRTLATWIGGAERCLIALDAPLGWPSDFGEALAAHTAGEPLREGPLFNRQTDRFVRDTVGQRPLDVGADRIARTARAALRLLEEIRKETGHPIPLVWRPDFEGVGAIEVYPAATLRAHGLPHRRYKEKGDTENRAALAGALSDALPLPEAMDFAALPSDELDAVLCVLAARDFLAGEALPPEDGTVARKEGWIWVKAP